MERKARIERIADSISKDMVCNRADFRKFVDDDMFDQFERERGTWEGYDVYHADTNGNGHLYELVIFVNDHSVYFKDETYNSLYYEKGDDWELELDPYSLSPYAKFPFSKHDFITWFNKRVDEGLEEGQKALDERPDGVKTADDDEEKGDADELDELKVGMGYVTISNGDKVSKCYIPNWSLPYLVNGDESGLNDEDKKLVDDWWKRNGIILVNPIDGTEEDFIAHPEFGGGSDCMVCYVHWK